MVKCLSPCYVLPFHLVVEVEVEVSCLYLHCQGHLVMNLSAYQGVLVVAVTAVDYLSYP